MKTSLSQAALTLLVVGLTLTAFSDRASARGGGGGSHGGGSRGSFSSRSSGRPSFSMSRPTSMSLNKNRAFHPTSFNSFSAFSKNNRGTSPKTALSKPMNLNKGLGLGASRGIQPLKLAGSSGKPSNLSKPFSKYGYGKYGYGKYGKYGYGKYGKYGKYWHPWYGWWYPGYGCYGGCDYSCNYDNPYDDFAGSSDGSPIESYATSAEQPPADLVLIVNPAVTQSTLTYSINGRSFTLRAGASQQLDATPGMTIEFDRGLSGDPARYSLSPGTYTFTSTDKGWDLVSGSAAVSATPGLALNAPQAAVPADAPLADPGIGVPETSVATDASPAGPGIGSPEINLSAGIRRK